MVRYATDKVYTNYLPISEDKSLYLMLGLFQIIL